MSSRDARLSASKAHPVKSIPLRSRDNSVEHNVADDSDSDNKRNLLPLSFSASQGHQEISYLEEYLDHSSTSFAG